MKFSDKNIQETIKFSVKNVKILKFTCAKNNKSYGDKIFTLAG